MAEWLAVDQSTSATKAVVFDDAGRVLARASREHRQYYPRPGRLEHDPEEIHANVLAVIGEAAGARPDVGCLSLTNQRETIVVFDRVTGQALCPAIVWQDRRGAPVCDRMIRAGHAADIESRTGLRIDTYFPAPKLARLFEDHPEIEARVRCGDAAVGTIDAYLIHRLTQGRVFATDHTNACRTLLYDIDRLAFSGELCGLFGVPASALPEVRDGDAVFGHTDAEGRLPRELPIRGVLGDSHAALLAQRCFEAGEAKVTFGTGSSFLVNIGKSPRRSGAGLVTTLGWVLGGRPAYACEGIINCTGGAINWLRDELGLIDAPEQSEALANSVPDSGGVYLVPAFAGLSAPYWAPEARGAIVGLTRGSTRAHVVRAALESVAYQVRDVVDLMAEDRAEPLSVLNADGGMTANATLMQRVADMVNFPVQTARVSELSPLGAAMAAMLGSGAVESLEGFRDLPMLDRRYEPTPDRAAIEAAYAGWQEAVRRVL